MVAKTPRLVGVLPESRAATSATVTCRAGARCRWPHFDARESLTRDASHAMLAGATPGSLQSRVAMSGDHGDGAFGSSSGVSSWRTPRRRRGSGTRDNAATRPAVPTTATHPSQDRPSGRGSPRQGKMTQQARLLERSRSLDNLMIRSEPRLPCHPNLPACRYLHPDRS